MDPHPSTPPQASASNPSPERMTAISTKSTNATLSAKRFTQPPPAAPAPLGAESNPQQRLEYVQWMLSDEQLRSVEIDTRSGGVRVRSHSEPSRSVAFDADRLIPAPSEDPPEVLCWTDPKTGMEQYFRAPEMAVGWRRWLYLAGAAVTFVLAMIGVVMPGLPTTPFLLLTSYCLLRSSRELHETLLRSRTFGGLLRDWRLYRAVRRGVKTKSLVTMLLVVGASVVLMALAGLPARAFYGVVGGSMIGVCFILRLRVIR
ncbi:Inner membrane protein YbaN [Pseudobythopirellula maris]|uniref:Inner membrane protein YbaN n=1 Tax=Pseudobythopirellula maris TaxID=2527991 RepID=A0A5C5ZME6_9BACT|nr:YbaN family protein [Pseudobythopirellula maris]TWT88644.1 Inner membrane protein YbaN [Pseudobythopirellula maris]